MIERSGELADDVDELRAPMLANAARADQSEAEAQAAHDEVLRLKAEVDDLAEADTTAKVEIARLTSILKTLRRDRFGKKSEKLGSDEDEQQSFAFEEVETGLEEIGARPGANRVKISEDESIRLDVVRARFRLIVTIRPKYAFKEPAAILQAPAREHIVEAGLPTEALLARSPSPNTPTACRSIVRKLFSRPRRR
jgi:hypothetical protein